MHIDLEEVADSISGCGLLEREGVEEGPFALVLEVASGECLRRMAQA